MSASGKCPEALKINMDLLTFPTISPITTALATGMYPNELTLKLSIDRESFDSIASLKDALANPYCSKKLFLDIT